MLNAVGRALALDWSRRSAGQSLADLRALYGALTEREREVVAFVTAGWMNKNAAAEMGISEVTVKIHCGQAMRKNGARSFADLVRMADLLGVAHVGSRHA